MIKYCRRRRRQAGTSNSPIHLGAPKTKTDVGAISEYVALSFPLGGMNQKTIEVILMQINGPGILQFRRQVSDKLNAILFIE